MNNDRYDAVVIGGGFYGCSVAAFLAERGHEVLLIEQHKDLFTQASYVNQARIHNGYHYPRSLQTGYRSRINFPHFVKDFADCVVSDFTKLYCVATDLSKVTTHQFERFCKIIGAPFVPAREAYRKLFNPSLIGAVYEVQEYAFNSLILRDIMRHRMQVAGVKLRLGTRVTMVNMDPDRSYFELSNAAPVSSRFLFNCTYAGLRQVPGLGNHVHADLKLQITEMALIEPPEQLNSIGVTVMCGPFFSCMPFPPRRLHTLSHVRYTPHASWMDSGPGGVVPYELLERHRINSFAEEMLRDSIRYMPLLKEAKVRDSIFAVKALLMRNEQDDGRPIFADRSAGFPNAYTIMGGKLDNIYDVFAKLRLDGF